MTAAMKLSPTPPDDTGALLAAFAPFEDFCRAMLDAYVLVDMNGKVIKMNQLLCQLVGLKTKQILKLDNLDESLKMFIDNTPLLVKDIVKQEAPTRIDEVRGSVAGRDDLNFIVGIYPFKDLGAFILIRDVTAETNLQGKYKDAKNKSITDPLTTLYTRGYFEDYLKLQIKTLLELPEHTEQKMMSIIMTDIDFFKKVNDVHGHQAGDYVLKTVAGVMKKAFRKTDVICRYGGEEFLVILPVTNLKGTAAAAEKLREMVQAEKIMFEGKHIPVTISCGVAQLNIGKENYPATIARADGALYEAKKQGRNRVCIAT